MKTHNLKFLIPWIGLILFLFLFPYSVGVLKKSICGDWDIYRELCRESIDSYSKIVGILSTIITLLIGGVSAYFAVSTYRRNGNLERVKWLSNLYEKFYEKEDLKEIRDKLDETEDSEKLKAINELVEKEDTKFNDYLNFFEFVAFLKKSDQLNLDEVKAIFEYPLIYLEKHEKVRKYIEDKSKGYENLDELLKEIAKSKVLTTNQPPQVENTEETS
jgi:hypothetical protein